MSKNQPIPEPREPRRGWFAACSLWGKLWLVAGAPCLVIGLVMGLVAGGVGLGLGASLGVFLAWLLVFWLERDLVGRLAALRATTVQVAKMEDVSIRTPVAGTDEVGRLAADLNAMLAGLQVRDEELRRHRDHLGEMVAQRTAELMQLNQALLEARDKVEGANRAKSSFLANLSHELRTPLTAVIGYSEVLLEEATATGRTQQQADLQQIRSAGRHLQTLLSEVLDLSKIEAGRMTLPVEEFALRAVAPPVQTVATTFEPPWVRPSAGGPCVLVIDDDPQARDLMARFLMKDGFSVQTAADGRKGLTMARQLRPALITLDVMMPEVDGWSVLAALKADPELATIPVFMISMTEEQAQGVARGAAEFLSKPVDFARLAVLLHELCPGSGTHPILVVEDDEMSGHLLRRNLEKEGYPTLVAPHGRAALELLKLHLPAVILLDLMMPEMDGFEFLQAVRDRRALQQIPIIVLTGKELTDAERDRLTGHGTRILSKQNLTIEALQVELQGVLARPSTAPR